MRTAILIPTKGDSIVWSYIIKSMMAVRTVFVAYSLTTFGAVHTADADVGLHVHSME